MERVPLLTNPFGMAIVDAVPCAEAIKFVSTGTEATFHALRLARAYTGKQHILKFEGGFHGVHDYALVSAFGMDEIQVVLPESPAET